MSQPNVIPFPATDLITKFMEMTASDDTPHLYKQWAAISLIAGALERRVWTVVGHQAGQPRKTFPNVYVFLVGAPGVGKYIVESVQELWLAVGKGNGLEPFHVAESNLTKASLIDRLAEAARIFLPPKGGPYEYNSLLVAAEEFGVFLPTHDLNFISVLNKIYNNPDSYSERRRHGPATNIQIHQPVLTILAGVQPSWLATVFPDEAWGMGFTSRIMMIYGSAGAPTDPFQTGLARSIERIRLVEGLEKLSQLYGEVKWEPEAKAKITDWALSGAPPKPTHSKLEHYCNRRVLHAIKLSIISSVSRTGRAEAIETIDVDRSMAWLLEAEKYMPDAFRAMIGKSDYQIMEDMYNHLVSLYGMAGNKPIHISRLITFLSLRIPSDKVMKILELAEKSNMIDRMGGTDTYVPKARTEFAE